MGLKMARIPQSISFGQTATTAIQTIYTGSAGDVLAPALVFTNASTNIIEISVFINDGTTDVLIEKRKIAGGIGNKWIVSSINTQKINPLDSIKFQANTANAVNHHLSGSITNDD